MIAYVTIMSAFLGASAQSSDRFLSNYNAASSKTEEDSFDCQTDCNYLTETDCRATSLNAQGCHVMYLHRKFHACLPCEAEFPACESIVDGDECFRFNCPAAVENGDFLKCLADDQVSRECYPEQQFTAAAILTGSYVQNLEECLELCHRVYGSGCQSVSAVGGKFDGLRCRLLSDSIQGKQHLLTSVYGDDEESYFADDEEPSTSVHCELK